MIFTTLVGMRFARDAEPLGVRDYLWVALPFVALGDGMYMAMTLSGIAAVEAHLRSGLFVTALILGALAIVINRTIVIAYTARHLREIGWSPHLGYLCVIPGLPTLFLAILLVRALFGSGNMSGEQERSTILAVLVVSPLVTIVCTAVVMGGFIAMHLMARPASAAITQLGASTTLSLLGIYFLATPAQGYCVARWNRRSGLGSAAIAAWPSIAVAIALSQMLPGQPGLGTVFGFFSHAINIGLTLLLCRLGGFAYRLTSGR
jgi:hypothetical protein